MEQHTRRIAGPAIAIALLFLMAACGGKETVASKSAEAFREAQKKGTPMAGGGHGGHAAGQQSTMTGMDQSTMTGMDHSTMTGGDSTTIGMDHSTMTAGQAMAGMDHSKMSMRPGESMAGMDHSQMQMQPGQPMAGMDHSKMDMKPGQSMAGMDHSQMQMQPGQPMTGMDHSSMPAMHHGAAGPPVVIPPPTSNSEIQRIEPSAILKHDPFDAPAQSSLSEAAKARQGRGDEGLARGITPGEDSENAPTPAPASRDLSAQGSTAAPATDHSGHVAPPAQAPPQARTTASAASQPSTAEVYTCLMHPEVTSDEPGKCPKCGMTLVKKK